MEKKEIRAVYTEESIRVYQAYSPRIALEALELGHFGPNFRLNRMSWIKPSFLWMMYRSGWAEKEGQEHVLAIDIRREAFDGLLEAAVLSTWSEDSGLTQLAWKERVARSDVRCQWDPERDIWGNALPYRSIQLGLRGKAIEAYARDWILSIEDLRPYVRDLNARKLAGEDITALLPPEKVYPAKKLP